MCGTVRTVSAAYPPRGRYTGRGDAPELIAKMRQWDIPYWIDREPYRRCLENLKCATCGRVTEHAMVFDERQRDINEEQDHQVTLEWQDVDRFANDFRALGMDVVWRDDMVEDLAAGIRQYLDDNTWSLELNALMPADRVLRALTKLWKVALEFECDTKWYVHPGRRGGWRPDRYVGYSGN